MGFIMTSSYMYDVITPLTSFCAPNTLILKKNKYGCFVCKSVQKAYDQIL